MISYFLHRQCMFHAITGWYCPGCGGTRALYFFLPGHWIKSFVYQPLVLYTFVALCYITIRYIITKYKKYVYYGSFPSHKHNSNASHAAPVPKAYLPSPMWLWGALILLVINFIIKNILLIGFHIDLLTDFLPL